MTRLDGLWNPLESSHMESFQRSGELNGGCRYTTTNRNGCLYIPHSNGQMDEKNV